ncbi:MAG TPA: hypothetical protein ENK02_01585 [Planctomycetes bacterium]|nr:hypothetical protein [Planctomycetota bacterium]
METRSQSRMGLPILVTFYLLLAMGAGGEVFDSALSTGDRAGRASSASSLGTSSGPVWELMAGRPVPWAWGLGYLWGGGWVHPHKGLGQAANLPAWVWTPPEDLALFRSGFPAPRALGHARSGVRSFLLPAPRAPSS